MRSTSTYYPQRRPPSKSGIMRLTFFTETGQTYAIEIDPHMELEDIMALLEVEVVQYQSYLYTQLADSCNVPSPGSRWQTKAYQSTAGRWITHELQCLLPEFKTMQCYF